MTTAFEAFHSSCERANAILLVGIVVSFAFPGYAEFILPNCTIADATLATDNTTVNVSCTTVGFANVLVEGSMTLNISISGIVAANPGRGRIDVSISNVTIRSGATLAVDSRGYTSEPAGGGPTVSIMIQSLIGSDGCLLFLGSFPSGTTILVHGAQMVSSTSTAPMHPALDPVSPTRHKMIMLVNVSITNNSSIIFTNSSLVATNPASFDIDTFSMTGGGPITFSHGSALSLDNCLISTSYGDVLVVWNVAAFSYSSFLSVISCTLTAGGARTGFLMWRPVTFSNSSYLALSSCSMTVGAGGHAFWMNSAASFGSSSYLLMRLSTLSSGMNGITFDVLSFSNGSHLTVELCNITSQAFSVAFAAPVLVSGSSSWAWTNCMFTSLFVAVGFRSSLTIHNSTWVIDNCANAGSGGLAFSSSRVLLTDASYWEVRNTSFYASTSLLLYGAVMLGHDITNTSAPQSSLDIRGMSVWTFSRCNFSGTGAASAVLLSKTRMTVANGSTWAFVDCIGESAGMSGSLTYSASTLTIQQSSEFKILRSAFAAPSSSALSFTAKSQLKVEQLSAFVIENGTLQGSSSALMVFEGSSIQLGEMSAWVISGVRLETTGSDDNGVIQLKGEVSVAQSCMFALRSNALRMLGAGQCCADLGALSTWGSAHVTDNSCNGVALVAGAAFLCRISVAAAAFVSVVERCNVVNGALWRPLKSSPPDYSGMVSLQCGRCDRTVDCFWPLTQPASFTKMPCGDDHWEAARHCPCLALCGGQVGLMCLPGIGTVGADHSSHGSSCPLNGADSKPRLQWTLTLSASSTRSVSPRMAPTVRRLRQDSTALHAATVAFATTAVLLSGPSGAGMMQRMQAQQLLNSCGEKGGGDGSMDFSSSPTQMQLGPDESSGKHNKASMAYVRGTVVGNLLIWFGFVVVACVATKIVMHRRAPKGGFASSVDCFSWWAIAAELELPGRLYWPYSMLSVPTLTSSVMLLLPSDAVVRSNDVALGVLGIVMCTSPAAAAALVTTGHRFRGTALLRRSRSEGDLDEIGASLFMRSKKWIQRELSGRWEWVDRRRARGFVKRWGALFDAYGKGRQWFVVVELAASTTAAVLAGLAPLDDGAVCQDLQVLSAAAAVAFLASVVLLQPYGSQIDGRLANGNAAATAVSSVLGVIGVDTTMLTAAQAILNGVSALSIVVALVVDGSIAQSLRDLMYPLQLKTRTLRLGLPGGGLIKGNSSPVLCMSALHQMLTRNVSTAADRKKVLDDLVWIICENRPLEK